MVGAVGVHVLLLPQVVMSRTFGNASASGGVGVRMLVPLIDMLNHAGDETQGLMGDEPVAQDNVRWGMWEGGWCPGSSG
jgi:hypothetical protein